MNDTIHEGVSFLSSVSGLSEAVIIVNVLNKLTCAGHCER